MAELAENHAPGSPEALLLEVIERLSGLNDQMRQTQADRRWAQIPEVVQEPGYLPSTVDGSVLTVGPMVSDLVLITQAIVAVPAGASAVLQLGPDHFLPLTAGTYALPLRRLLGAADVRSLTIRTPTLTNGAGGPAALWLYGHQMAPTGSMAP